MPRHSKRIASLQPLQAKDPQQAGHMPAICISMCTIGWSADRRSYQGPNLVQPLPESIREAGCDGAGFGPDPVTVAQRECAYLRRHLTTERQT
jgi:hypothetical protein